MRASRSLTERTVLIGRKATSPLSILIGTSGRCDEAHLERKRQPDPLHQINNQNVRCKKIRCVAHAFDKSVFTQNTFCYPSRLLVEHDLKGCWGRQAGASACAVTADCWPASNPSREEPYMVAKIERPPAKSAFDAAPSRVGANLEAVLVKAEPASPSAQPLPACLKLRQRRDRRALPCHETSAPARLACSS